MIEDVVNTVQQLDADITVSAEIAARPLVKGDAALLHQLLLNLGTNALRYNRPHGRIHFTLARNGTHASATVENTGRAIPPEKAAHIFNRFFRVDPDRSRQTGGHGLGLNLAAEIAKAHDAIRFRLTMPLAPEDTPLG